MEPDTKQTNRARDQARAQLNIIIELMAALDKAQEADDTVTYENDKLSADDLIDRCCGNVLDVRVCSEWHSTPNLGRLSAIREFRILLRACGPAVQIIGELSAYYEPQHVILQYQDWGMPWTDYYECTRDEDDLLLDYCRLMDFGGD